VKLKRKITLTKGKKFKRMRNKLVKIIYHKFGLKDEIENE
jgi:hypothetical protein